MQLDIKHWQMLKAISESGSLGKAADNLDITQSALSHRLAEAERRLGGALFEREGRRLRLTPAGSAMTQTAQQILPALQRAEADFIRIANQADQLIKIGVAAYSCFHWLPVFLRRIKHSHPGLQIELVSAATQNPMRSLFENQADLVLAPGHQTQSGIISQPLFTDELVLITPPDHPLAERPYIQAEDLQQENYLTYSRTAQPGFEYERFIRPSGMAPRYVQVVEMTDAIVELIATGFGVSILSRWALATALDACRVCASQVGEQGLDLHWSILMRESEVDGSAARVLADTLHQWFNRTI